MGDTRWLESLVANVPGALYRCACKRDWEMEFISDGIEQITGYPASEFIGNRARSYVSVIHPDDRATVQEVVDSCVARREPFILEYRVLTANGDVLWVQEQGRAVCDADDEVLYLDGSIFDIGERKCLEARLEYLGYHDALTGLPTGDG